ncbi:ABC transporter substrate-binding protein [Falsirhodobacter sp. 1013]|uniref:ABC transporter substrate-binding protein n=1 Tax=Falsirhodobacter sp. 1013 TaxID=3417566 RepID=UPI003EB719D6
MALKTCLAALGISALAIASHAETLTYAGTTAPLTFDPHATNDFVTTSLVRQTYESLVELGPEMELVPGLATEWTYRGDNTWRLVLRQGVVFHDGTRMTPADVVFSIKRQASSKLYQSLFGGIIGAVVVDDRTVDVISKAPDAILPVKLTRLFVMSEAWADANNIAAVPELGNDASEAFSLRHANGTGPMELELQEPGKQTILIKNPDWWGEFTGNVDRAEYTAIGSAPTRLAALLSGEIDLVTDLPLQDIQRVEGTDGLKIAQSPQRLFMELEMDGSRDQALDTFDKSGNPLPANPFKDIRVRQAVAKAVDSKLIVDRVMRGHAKPINLPSAPGFYGYQADLDTPRDYDLEGAKALLAEAGYAGGFTTTLNCPLERYVNAEEICRGAASMLARIGIDLNVKTMTWPEFSKILVSGPNSSFHLIGAAGNSGDVQDTFTAIISTRSPETGRGQQNWALWSDADFDAITDRLVTTFDGAERTALYREGLTIARDRVHAVYLHQPFITWAMRDGVDAKVRADSAVNLSQVTVN